MTLNTSLSAPDFAAGLGVDPDYYLNFGNQSRPRLSRRPPERPPI
jgi:hypothetical protein